MTQVPSDKLMNAIKEKTKEVTQSKEEARRYLRKSGIADILENGNKQKMQNKTSSNKKKDE